MNLRKSLQPKMLGFCRWHLSFLCSNTNVPLLMYLLHFQLCISSDEQSQSLAVTTELHLQETPRVMIHVLYSIQFVHDTRIVHIVYI